MVNVASPMKTIRNTLSTLPSDSSVKAALLVKDGLNDLVPSMFYAGYKSKFSGAEAGRPAA